MKPLSLSQAARQVGKSKSAISRAIQEGRLAAVRAANGHFVIDPADLVRAFPPEDQSRQNADPIGPAEQPASAHAEQPASAPAEQPASAHAEQPASAPAEQVASAPAEEVASAPAEEVVALEATVTDLPESPVDRKLEAGAKHGEFQPLNAPSSLRSRFFNVVDPIQHDAKKLARSLREAVTSHFLKN